MSISCCAMQKASSTSSLLSSGTVVYQQKRRLSEMDFNFCDSFMTEIYIMLRIFCYKICQGLATKFYSKLWKIYILLKFLSWVLIFEKFKKNDSISESIIINFWKEVSYIILSPCSLSRSFII